MAGLLRDRYFECAPHRAWDLVTGEPVSPAIEKDEQRTAPAPAPLIELLEHGVEGVPRWIVADVKVGQWRTHARLAAGEASRRGYVPIAVDIFLRVRTLLAADLRTRALVLIARSDTPIEQLQSALLHAAALSSGPHLLIAQVTARVRQRTTLWRAAEARADYGASRFRAVPRGVHSEEAVQLLERARHSADLVQIGRHAAAERLLRDVAASLVRRRALGAAAETYVALGRLLLERGRASDADAAFAEAAAQAEAAADMTLVLPARIWQAAARTDAGQLTAGESLCRAALLTAASDSDERIRAEATLGRVLLWQGRLAEASALPFVRQSTVTDPFTAATAIRILIESGELFEAGRRARDLLDRSADPPSRLIASAAHLRVLLAAGDLQLAGEHLRAFAGIARSTRAPLRLARMRLLWSDALRRAGKAREADRELRSLARLRSALPPLLRSAIDCRLSSPVQVTDRRPPRARAISHDVVGLVGLAQREDDDTRALKGIGDFLLRELQATRVAFWTTAAGPPTAVITCGTGLPTRLGARALEAGITIGPEAVESGCELAAPVRLGPDLIAAIAIRWPADRSPADDASSLLAFACAVAAPRLESLIGSGRQTAQAATAIPELVGISGAMADVRRAVMRAATAPFSALIEGESGVGKELVARAIHQLGPRRDRRFCDVNCAALPDDLFESELFGHARGAFTGAVSDRPGLVEEADGGTLFLDEVAELSARAQAKLLRVIQQQEVRRIGETFSRKVDVRFVSAANRDLRLEGEHARFRQDLLYRLDVIRIRIPPLRERSDDIPVLARHFWGVATARVNTQAVLSHAVLTALAQYHWPGNVRELQNVMSALAVEAPARGSVRAALLPDVIGKTAALKSARLSDARRQWERRFIEGALARAGGNRSRAARDLGLTRQGLLKLLARLDLLSPPDGVKKTAI